MSKPTTEWTDVAVAITAIVAIVISLFSLWYARASFKLARTQDDRRAPKLTASYRDGDYAISPNGARTYRISVSVGNMSDADNSLARAELKLSYRSQHGAQMIGRFSADAPVHKDDLALPKRLSAHETVAGCCRFTIPGDVLTGSRVEGYSVELIDTHECVASITPLILSERRS